MMEKNEDANQPVSVIVDREVLPDKREDFELCLKGVIEACRVFPGSMGTDVSFPDSHNELHYRVVFRFSTLSDLKVWEKSPERLYWIQKIDKLIKEPTQLQVVTGLETWFALPKTKSIVPPKRYKMAFITWFALTPLLIVFNLAVQPWLGHWHLVPRILISTPILVLIMTYFLMPLMAKVFSAWLYPQRNKP